MLHLGDAIEVRDNRLSVVGELGPERESDFADAVDFASRAEGNALVIDLKNVPFMNSIYIRYIVWAAIDALSSNKSVTVLGQGVVLRLLRAAGLDRMGNVKLIGDGESPLRKGA